MLTDRIVGAVGKYSMKAKRLGYDYSLNHADTRHTTKAMRYKNFLARDAVVRRKFKRLRSPMLYHAGLVPAVGYGAELTAMPDLMLRKISTVGLRHHGLQGLDNRFAWMMLAASDYTSADPLFTLP